MNRRQLQPYPEKYWGSSRYNIIMDYLGSSEINYLHKISCIPWNEHFKDYQLSYKEGIYFLHNHPLKYKLFRKLLQLHNWGLIRLT